MAARAIALLIFVGMFAWAPAAPAYETDEYSNRLEPIADSAPVLDGRVNDALADIAARWRQGEDRERFAFEVYQRLGGVFWVDHIERFAMKSPEIERLPQYRWNSIYRGAPFWAARVEKVFGVGATIRLAGSLVGSDKLGHFFSQGFKYFKSYLAGWSERRILERGRFNERWIFGQWTTGVFSNADLVADYEGYRFYRSLFEDGIVPGEPAIVRFEGGFARIQRPFHWSDYVDDYWDEALNPSYLSPGLAKFMAKKLPALCNQYFADPARYVPRHEAELKRRYAALGLRQNLRFRMDHVCRHLETAAAGSTAKRGGTGGGSSP